MTGKIAYTETITTCPSCGERELEKHIQNEECRECRGETKPRRRRTGYVSPDEYERRGDFIDQRQTEHGNQVANGGVL